MVGGAASTGPAGAGGAGTGPGGAGAGEGAVTRKLMAALVATLPLLDAVTDQVAAPAASSMAGATLHVAEDAHPAWLGE